MKNLILTILILNVTGYAENIPHTGTLNVGSGTQNINRYSTNISSKKYASDAIKMAKANKDLGCGYGGGRWGLSWNDHKNWSQSVSMNEIINEYKNRKRLLIQCIQRKY